MLHVCSRKSFSTLRPIALSLALLSLFLIAVAPICQAQRNSGAAAITLTAVLSQSLSMSVTPAALNSGSFSGLFSDRAASQKSALTISTKWVRGQGRVSVEVFAPGNPLLGAAGQALVPVEVSAPGTDSAFAPAGNGFLSPSRAQQSAGLPEFRINTSDLQIPAGSEAGMLTIRAQVL